MKKLLPLFLFVILLGGCRTGISRYYGVEGGLRSQQGDTQISIRAIRCGPQNQQYSIPGFLTVNAEANGLLVELKDSDESRNLKITKLSAYRLVSPASEVDIEIPYQRWYGESTVHKNIHYAFLKLSDYSESMTLGPYSIRLEFEANGVRNLAIFDLNYIVQKRLETNSLIPNYN